MANPGQHRDPEGTSRWSWIRRRLPGWDRPLCSAVVLGAAMGVVVGVVTASEASSTEGLPRERATVVAIMQHDSLLPGCGRGMGQEQDITWRSTNPPAGLPAEFLDKGQCLDASVGDKQTVVRVVDGGEVQTYVNPSDSLRQAVEDGLLLFAITFAVVFLATRTRLWWLGRERP